MDLDTFKSDVPKEIEERAKIEINEIPSDRLEACRKFYEWIQSQSHISCPGIDTKFLLWFLRGSKWSQLRARDMLQGYLTMKLELNDWFDGLTPTDPNILAIIDSGYMLKLPKRDKDGAQLIILRHGQLDANYKTYKHTDVQRLNVLLGTCLGLSETTQICGAKYMIDFNGATRKHITNLVNPSDLQKFQRTWKGNSPGRQRGILLYNVGSFFEMVMTIVRPFMPKKYQQRLKVYNSPENLYKDVPMEILPREYLPDDYEGPHAGSIQEIIDNFKKELTNENFVKLIKLRCGPEFYLDKGKKPKDEKPTGAFRKLDV